DDLLDLSRLQAGGIELHKRAVDAAELARDAMHAFKAATAEKRQVLRFEILPGLGEVIVDPERIELVFTNLLGNAVKYTPEGGTITVSAVRRDDGKTVRYTVSDTGPGIPPEYRQAVFDKLFRMPGAKAT